jgi:endonuclease G
MDHSKEAIIESNYMTNILPQTYVLNRGAWLYSEEITECTRDINPLYVYGGIIMGDDETNDIFQRSHGIRTPDLFWKIIENLETGDVIAWIMPNTFSAARSTVDQYLTSINEIEQQSGFYFPHFTEEQRFKIHSQSWPIQTGCDKSK